MDLRKLGNLFLEASNVAEENKSLKCEMQRLKYAMDENLLRRKVSELEQQIRDLEHEIKKLRESQQLHKQRAGNQKHIADMLQVQLDLLKRKV